MLLKADRIALLTALNDVAPAVQARGAMPILANAMIDATGDVVTVSATNLDQAVVVEVPDCTIVGSGKVLLFHSTLVKLLKAVSDSEVEIACQPEDHEATFTAGETSAVLMTMDADEFPDIGHIFTAKKAAKFKMDGALIGDIKKRVLPSVSTDETRPVLMGVSLKFAGGQLKAASTNGHRLMVFSYATAGMSKVKDFDVVVPADALKSVSCAGKVDVTLSESWISFSHPTDSGRKSVFSRLVEGPFVDYDQVTFGIEEGAFTVSVARKKLQEVLALLGVASSRLPRATFTVTGDGMTVKAESSQVGIRIVRTVPISFEGDKDVTFALNPDYLSHMLQTVYADTVLLRSQAPELAFVIRGAGDEGTDAVKVDSVIRVLMPMRLDEDAKETTPDADEPDGEASAKVEVEEVEEAEEIPENDAADSEKRLAVAA